MADPFDVVIVGARCAGAPLATLLAQAGLRVLVVEQARFPQETLSSHITEADGLAFLARLGLTERLVETGTAFINRTDLRLEDVRIEIEWPLLPGDVAGMASIRRGVLDPILVDAAVEAGAYVRMGTTVTGLIEDHARVAGVQTNGDSSRGEVRARLVVGADGRSSTVARLAGARRYNVVPNQRPTYWRYFENVDIGEPTFISHRWGRLFAIGLPTDAGLYQVIAWPEFEDLERRRGELEEMFIEQVCSCDPIANRLCASGVRSMGKLLGARRWESFFREPSGPGWVLVGDAGHFKDPGPGRGIGDAFLQVDRLAPVIAGALDQSEAQLDEALREWGRWRDAEFAEHYWFAIDSSSTGTVPAVLPELMRQLHAAGAAGEFLDVLNHRAVPSQLTGPPRILRATAAAVRRGPVGAVLREVAELARQDRYRRRLNRRPAYEQPIPRVPAASKTPAHEHTPRSS